MVDIDESILNSTKKLLGIAEDYDAFDTDIVMHINSVFNTLSQLGLHPTDGFTIEDENSVWSEYIDNQKLYNSVKTYMYLKVRLLFDPPTTSFAIESFAKQIQEYEWRINVQIEEINPPNLTGGPLV